MTHFRTWLALSLVAALAAPGLAQAQKVPASERCRAITRAEVRALFDHWNAALATDDPDTVVRTYAPDAVLLPTVKSGPLIGPAAIRGYFVTFLKKHPHGRIDTRTIHVGCNIAYDVGLYTFTLDGPTPDLRQELHARYTYIYAPIHGHWLIVHHHSSVVPQAGH